MRAEDAPTCVRSADSPARSGLGDRVVLILRLRSHQVRMTTAAISVATSARELRRCVTPPHFGNLQFGVAGILTADFGEAAQCGQHFIPGWGPW